MERERCGPLAQSPTETLRETDGKPTNSPTNPWCPTPRPRPALRPSNSPFSEPPDRSNPHTMQHEHETGPQSQITNPKELAKYRRAWVAMHGSHQQTGQARRADHHTLLQITHQIPGIFCGHRLDDHVLSVAQPQLSPSKLHPRTILSRYAEISSLECTACAQAKSISRAHCFIETLWFDDDGYYKTVDQVRQQRQVQQQRQHTRYRR